jgi:Spy/CpxP family protein refolding chaperone
MKTKTKVLTGLVLSTVLASGLYASCGGKQDRGDKSSCQMKGKYQKKMMKHSKKHMMPIMKAVKQLDLSDEQRTKIKDIFKEERKAKKSAMNEAFTKDSFDKQKFVELMKEKRENMLKSKANMIEKIHNVLDTKQKEQFKTLIDIQKEKMVKKHHHKG